MIKRLSLTLLFVLAVAVPSFAAGPTVLWDYQISALTNVNKFQTCIDGVCTDIASPTRTDSGTTATFSTVLPNALTIASHTIVVNACNAIACTGSVPLTVTPPDAALNVRVR